MTYEEKKAEIEAMPHGPERFMAAWQFQREILDMSASGKLWQVTPEKKQSLPPAQTKG